jgi:SAM-dependent methyltransferase
MNTLKKSQEFWRDRSAPVHVQDNEDFYGQYVKELKALLPPSCRRTLEIGCGTGALYPYLKDIFGDYLGVDFSERMLSVFRKRYPTLNLVCAEGSTYIAQGSYDLILCNSVLQDFDWNMTDRLLSNFSKMIAPDGICVIGMIPDLRLRSGFVSNYLRNPPRTSVWWKNCLRYLRHVLTGRDGVGSWYDALKFKKLAESFGFECSICGSMYYRYRFHAILRAFESRGQDSC